MAKHLQNSKHPPVPESRSPWAGLQGVEQITVAPATAPVHGSVTIPGSKSLTNRALLIAGAASEGTSTIRHFLKSDDSYWCIEVLRQLGLTLDLEADSLRLISRGRWPHASADLFVGSAGTIARFLPGLLASAPRGRYTVDASAQLRQRPLGHLLHGLDQLGATITYLGAPQQCPFRIDAHGLSGGRIEISGDVSSQFISGLLICAPLARDAVEIVVTSPIVQQDYVDMTLDVMAAFGVTVDADAARQHFRVAPQSYQPTDYTVEGDASTASYFAALAAVTGGTVTLNNLSPHTRQPDIRFLEILEQMGCRVTRNTSSVHVAAPARLTGGLVLDMKPMSDTALTVAALAPFADAPITVRNVAHIRAHESDRIHVMVESLCALGIPAQEHNDGFTIHPAAPHAGVTLDTHDDHRVAMALAILGAGGNGITLRDPGCTSKTCPEFFTLLNQTGVMTHVD